MESMPQLQQCRILHPLHRVRDQASTARGNTRSLTCCPHSGKSKRAFCSTFCCLFFFFFFFNILYGYPTHFTPATLRDALWTPPRNCLLPSASESNSQFLISFPWGGLISCLIFWAGYGGANRIFKNRQCVDSVFMSWCVTCELPGRRHPCNIKP